MMFDPPDNGTVSIRYQETIAKLEWMLCSKSKLEWHAAKKYSVEYAREYTDEED